MGGKNTFSLSDQSVFSLPFQSLSNDSQGDEIRLIMSPSEMKVRRELAGTTQEKTRLGKLGRRKEKDKQRARQKEQLEGRKERKEIYEDPLGTGASPQQRLPFSVFSLFLTHNLG